MMKRDRNLAWAALILGFALLWGFAKSAKIDALEYWGDLFTVTQAARNSLEHGLFYFDHAYGWSSSIHNYFLLVAVSPAAVLLGSWGASMSSVLLAAWASRLVSRDLSIPAEQRLGILLSLWSPAAYFVFDDLRDGWHLENLMLPLSALLAWTLCRGKLASRVVAFAAMIALREDGIIQAALIASAAVLLDEKSDLRKKFRDLAQINGAGFVVFVLGMTYLSSTGPTLTGTDARTRLLAAFQLFESLWKSGPEYRHLLAGSSLGALLLGMGWTFLAPAGRRLHTALVYLVCGRPLLLLFSIANSRYQGNPFYTALWAPRLAYLLGLGSALLILSWGTGGGRLAWKPSGPWSCRLTFASIIALQLGVLALNKDPWTGQGYSVFARPYRADLVITSSEKSGLMALSKSIPARTPVLVEPRLIAWFDEQTVLWAQVGGFFSKPRWIICDSARLFFPPSACLAQLQRYEAFGIAGTIGRFKYLEIKDPQAPFPMNPDSPLAQ